MFIYCGCIEKESRKHELHGLNLDTESGPKHTANAEPPTSNGEQNSIFKEGHQETEKFTAEKPKEQPDKRSLYMSAFDENRTEGNSAFKPMPRNLTCPAPLKDDIGLVSGAQFNPMLHQPRRDMYGGDPKKGIPKEFQNMLYDLSNAVIKASNYNDPNPDTKKVFSDKNDIYRYVADYLHTKLIQRNSATGEKMGKYKYEIFL